MKVSHYLLCLFSLSIWSISNAQAKFKVVYRDLRGNGVYVPLGKISFADEVVEFKLGIPKPLKKFQDSSQCLHEPNYTRYEDPDFVSLGCGGQLMVKFTNNGFMNLPGDDIYIFEVGPSREPATVEVSKDGKNWIYAGRITGGKSSIDMEDQGVDRKTVFYFMRITDLKSVCNSKTAGVDIDAIAAINSVIKLHVDADVLFDVDSFQLKRHAVRTLDSLAKVIVQIPKASILIEGHTDSDASENYNLRLSQNRCISVRKKLIALFEASGKYEYETIGYGEAMPRVPNDSKENKHLNRRVEITVLPPRRFSGKETRN